MDSDNEYMLVTIGERTQRLNTKVAIHINGVAYLLSTDGEQLIIKASDPGRPLWVNDEPLGSELKIIAEA